MRCYNGCPDSALQAKMDEDAKARRRLASIGCRATYFPMEQMWMVFDKDHNVVTGFHPTIQQAAGAAMRGE